MGTGYSSEVKITIEGRIYEDVDTRNTAMFRAQLQQLCIQYGLTWEEIELD